MKLQSASLKEIRRISIGTVACDGIMVAGLFLLSQFDIGKFDLFRILLLPDLHGDTDDIVSLFL